MSTVVEADREADATHAIKRDNIAATTNAKTATRSPPTISHVLYFIGAREGQPYGQPYDHCGYKNKPNSACINLDATDLSM